MTTPIAFENSELAELAAQVGRSLRAVLQMFSEHESNPRIDFAVGVIEARSQQIAKLPH
jgi:hypothetical protein